MNRKLFLRLNLCVILFIVIFIAILNTSTTVYAGIDYGVYVDGKAVTDENKDDVLGNGNGEIVYTPATDQETAVLTFNDDCEIAGITCTTNDIIITSGSEKAVTVTLTAPILLGNNGESNKITIKGNSETNNLTIKPKQTDEINAFRPIGIRSGNTLIMQDNVVLKDSNATAFGGGMINVANGATLELQGGIIQNSKVTTDNYDNTSVYLGRGGAIYVADGGNFKMSGGEIKNCSASVAGGAIYSYGTVEITGGQITGCSVSGSIDDTSGSVKAKGGAIYLFKGVLTMTGGKITNNTLDEVADMRGAGIYAASGVKVILGGTAEIENNKDGKNNNSNLFLYDNVEFTISTDKKPETGMKAYITTKTSPTINNPIKISTNGTEADKAYIISDDDKYGVAYNKNGFLELQNAYKVTVNVNNADFGTAEATLYSATEGTKIELSAIAKTGYRFNKWESSDVDASLGEFSMPAKDVLVIAVFEKIPKYIVEFNSNGGSEIEAISVEEGNCVNEPTSPTKEKMNFAGWYTDEKLTDSFNFKTPITRDITLYAKWVEKEKEDYEVTSGNITFNFTDEANHNFKINLFDMLTLSDEKIEELGYSKEELSKVLNTSKENLAKYGKLLNIYTIEIEDSDYEYTGKTEIKIKMTEDMKACKSLKFICLDDNNNFKVSDIVDLRIEGDYLVGTLPHLSIYALVGEIEETNSENPKTGDMGIGIWVTLITISMIGIIGTAQISRKK